ncbi:MAG: hypothetical protein DCF17_19840 [Shackletoniella antarctica]|uniref:Uncharacterized protein n=1 Tax=Shackletoniella antarctica TaxID=268115 RepID=A0A2W4XTX5_9CYAN|nr:MAG: hypothetical protein DCF17_19840 [Shackletoniella antarctica]
MIHPSHSPDIEPVYQLLDGYSFDVEAHPTDRVIAGWLEQYGSVWVSHAITEALYQGRYKIISIEQILKLWQRRGQPIRHFNREFESIILGQTLLCPTGYGDGTESQATNASPSQPPETEAASAPQQLTPPQDDAAEVDLADSAALATSPIPAAPQGNPFDAAAIACDTAIHADAHVEIANHSQVIPNFRPLVTGLEPIWSQSDEIQPFVPRQDGSELHQRLRAVVRGGMRE